MGKTESRTSHQELDALHAALLRQRREAGTLEETIPMSEWEATLVRTLGVMTRQSCNDKTWAMQRLGYITWEKKIGVRINAGAP